MKKIGYGVIIAVGALIVFFGPKPSYEPNWIECRCFGFTERNPEQGFAPPPGVIKTCYGIPYSCGYHDPRYRVPFLWFVDYWIGFFLIRKLLVAKKMLQKGSLLRVIVEGVAGWMLFRLIWLVVNSSLLNDIAGMYYLMLATALKTLGSIVSITEWPVW